MSDVLKLGGAYKLGNGTNIRVALHVDGEPEITLTEAAGISTLIMQTLTDPRGKFKVITGESE